MATGPKEVTPTQIQLGGDCITQVRGLHHSQISVVRDQPVKAGEHGASAPLLKLFRLLTLKHITPLHKLDHAAWAALVCCSKVTTTSEIKIHSCLLTCLMKISLSLL